MDRFAVFVDAGYLFAQGSALLAGTKQPRKNLKLDETTAVSDLVTLAQKITTLELLRVYWYDGVTKGMLSTDQAALAHTNNVKLRVGFVNSAGEQKGVGVDLHAGQGVKAPNFSAPQ